MRVGKRDNIVSFEDARRTSRRSQAASSDARKGKAARSSRATRSANKDEWAMYASAPAKNAGKGSAARSQAPRKSQANRSEAFDETPRRAQLSQARPSGQRRASDGRAQKTTRSRANEAEMRERRKSQKAKGRASKQLDRAYAERADGARQAEGSPRAPMRKGEMGKSQRKQARMQLASEAGSVVAKINPAGWFSKINLSSRKAKIVTVAICAVFVCVFLYTPAQQYYQAVRDNARLEAEYAAVASRNDALDAHNDSLASDAGMEDAVRQKFGYIVAGEQTAVVSGLSEEVEASKRASAEVEANVLASSIKAPEEWYTPILDTLFGVE